MAPEVVLEAAHHSLIDPDVARRLEDAAGMRNVLVYLYDEIDFEILHASIGQALQELAELVAALEPFAAPSSATNDD